jgi:hypothetical protein
VELRVNQLLDAILTWGAYGLDGRIAWLEEGADEDMPLVQHLMTHCASCAEPLGDEEPTLIRRQVNMWRGPADMTCVPSVLVARLHDRCVPRDVINV